MLHAICEFAKQKGFSAEPGFKTKRVHWLLCFNNTGKFIGVVSQMTPGAKDGRGRLFPRCPDLSQPEIKAGGSGCRHFLVDSLEVIALLTKDGNPDAKLKAKHDYFSNLLRQAGENVPEPAFIRLADALDDTAMLASIRDEVTSGGHAGKPTDVATFAIPMESSDETRCVVESDNWHDWWRARRLELAQKRRAGKRPTKSSKSKTTASVPVEMRCLLSGELVVPAATHDKIEGLSDVGGLSMGDSLISFKQPSFCSFGLDQSANAAISEEMVATYRQTLNDLIANHSSKLAGAKVVYWFIGKTDVAPEDDPVQLLLRGADFGDAIGNDEPDAPRGASRRAEVQALGRARELLNAVRTGKQSDLANLRFNALSLSGNSGRVVVRDWMEGSFEELAQNVVRWFDALEITGIAGGDSADIAGLELLVTCALAERKRDQKYKDWVKPLGSVRESLWHASIGGGGVSESAAKRALLQHRAAVVNGQVAAALDPDGEKRPLRLATLYARMGLMKAWLNLNQPIEECTMEPILKEDHPSAVYQFGRLVAVLADLQREALRKESGETVKSSVVDRYYIAASVTPRLKFNQLVSMSNHHLRKLEQSDATRAAARAIKNRIADIHGRIDDARLPAVTGLDEQCLFALGYYQQIARMNADRSRAAAAKRVDTADAK